MVIGPSGALGAHAVLLAETEHKPELGTVPIHNHQMEVLFALEVVQKKCHAVQQHLVVLVYDKL